MPTELDLEVRMVRCLIDQVVFLCDHLRLPNRRSLRRSRRRAERSAENKVENKNCRMRPYSAQFGEVIRL